jgi:hypothetical protein
MEPEVEIALDSPGILALERVVDLTDLVRQCPDFDLLLERVAERESDTLHFVCRNDQGCYDSVLALWGDVGWIG